MKVVLFSPNGYIGKYIKERIQKEDNIQLFEITRNNILDQYNGNFDVFIYSAAVSNASVERYVQDNVVSAISMVNFCKDHRINKIIYLSTDSIYGDLNVDEVNEKTMMVSPNVYATTKYMAEKIIAESGIAYFILRMPGVVGKIWRNNFVCNTMSKLKNNECIKLFNADRNFNNILDIEDLVEFIILLCERNYGEINEIFLLGNTEKIKLKDLVLYMKMLCHSESEILNVNSNAKRCFTLNVDKAVKFGYVSKPIRTIIDNLHQIQEGSVKI